MSGRITSKGQARAAKDEKTNDSHVLVLVGWLMGQSRMLVTCLFAFQTKRSAQGTMRFLLCLLPIALGLSSPAETATKAVYESSLLKDKSVLVVGGGPVGLATALTLQKKHGAKVTVVEARTDISKYRADRTYLYRINQRGMQWTKQFESVHQAIETTGVETPEGCFAWFSKVPADPNEVATDVNAVGFPATKRAVWIPRQTMIDILLKECRTCSIPVLLGKGVKSIESVRSGKSLVQCTDGALFEADLVVGADGANSTVRSILAQKDSGFMPKTYTSPSTGLELRALAIPKDFRFQNGTETAQLKDDAMYSFLGANTESTTQARLGFLPSPVGQERPGNLILRQEHEVWKQKSGPEIKKWFQTNWPRFNWDLVSDKRWETLATSKSTVYPLCQYTEQSATDRVVLVGDACHAFPPDIGQGINAGLQDIVVLDQAIGTGKTSTTGETSKPVFTSSVLAAYQENRKYEHRALTRIARFGSPYQYNQSRRQDKIGKLLWTLNFALRMILSKLTFGILAPPIVTMMEAEPGWSYRKVMRKADRTASILTLLPLIAMLLLGRKLLPIGLQ